MTKQLRWTPAKCATSSEPGEAHVWAVPLDSGEAEMARFLASLSPDEVKRANTYRFDVPRRTFVIGRSALRMLLGSYLNVAPLSIELDVDHHQKPRLAGAHANSPIRFNVSHSDGLALIALTTDCEIGVDVERVRAVSHLEQIARRFFHPAEADAVLATPSSEQTVAFLRCWTGKEAVLKAVGTGISGLLNDFRVSLEEINAEWVRWSREAENGGQPRCWLQRLSPSGDYLGAVACVGAERTVRTWTFRL